MNPAFAISERAFQQAVIEAAQIAGWRVAHFRPAETKKGWRTPVQADGAGFPDLVLVKPPRVLFVELKAQTGSLTQAQMTWLTELGCSSQIGVFEWRPADWDEIAEVLL
jgi:hypothetical protein